jgi:hypothetical protein
VHLEIALESGFGSALTSLLPYGHWLVNLAEWTQSEESCDYACDIVVSAVPPGCNAYRHELCSSARRGASGAPLKTASEVID